MSCFRLLNERSVEKGLKALFSSLTKSNLVKSLPELAALKATTKEKVELDGFNLFSSSGSVRPYTWFMPKPKVSIPEFMRVYDRVADQPTHMLDSSGALAGHLYQRNSDERKLLSKMSGDDQWLSPSLLLAACAQYLGTDIESKTDNSVRLRLGTGIIDVSPAGCWSNIRRERVPNATPAIDANTPITYFPPIATYNPVLRALWELADGSTEGCAVTVAAYALEEDIISKAFLNKLAKLEGSVVEMSKTSVRDPQKARAALDQCEEILNHAVYDILPDLFEVAVPNLLSYKKLQAIVGSPSQARSGRAIREETLMNWRSKLQAEYESIPNAI